MKPDEFPRFRFLLSIQYLCVSKYYVNTLEKKDKTRTIVMNVLLTPMRKQSAIRHVFYEKVTNLLEGCLHSPVGQGRPMAHFPSHTSRANAMVS